MRRGSSSEASTRFIPVAPTQPDSSLLNLTHSHAEESDYAHPKQHEAVAEAVNVGCSVNASTITNGNIHDAKSKDARGEKEFEIAEGIEIAEILSPRNHSGVVMPCEQLRSAQRVAKTISKNS